MDRGLMTSVVVSALSIFLFGVGWTLVAAGLMCATERALR